MKNKQKSLTKKDGPASLAGTAGSLSSLPHDMQVALRGRYRKEENDPSADEQINALSPADKVRECVAWQLGYSEWADIVADWMKAAGAKPSDF